MNQVQGLHTDQFFFFVAVYGSKLLKRLSKDLKAAYGKGFSISNVYLIRQLYIKYEKFQTLSGKLLWSHYTELLSISDDIDGPAGLCGKLCVNLVNGADQFFEIQRLKNHVVNFYFTGPPLS